MSVLAHFELITNRVADQRLATRYRLSLGTVIEPCQSNVVIQNISTSGLLLEASAGLAEGDLFEVRLPLMASPSVARVVWHEETLFGCHFETAIPQAAISAALLRSVPLAHLEDHPGSDGATGDRASYAYDAGDALPNGSLTVTRSLMFVAIATLFCAGLTYVLLTSSTTILIVLVCSFALLGLMLIASCAWALDNTPAI